MLDPVDEAARTAPDALALVDGDLRLTWADLAAEAGAAASRLASAGVGPGDRVAVLAGASAAFVVLVHAARRAGVVLAALSPRAVVAEVAWQLGHAEPRLLLHDAVRADLAAAAAATLAPGSRPAVLDLHVACHPGGTAVGENGAPAAPILTPATDVVVTPLDAPGLDAAGADPGSGGGFDPADVATILYTSGTTGRPKGAILTWANHLASARAWASVLDPRPSDRWLLALPVHHVAGIGTIVRAAAAGSAVVCAGDGFDAARVVGLMDREGVTHVSVVAATLDRLVDALPPGHGPGSLRAVLLGGGPWSPSAVGRAVAAGLPVVTSYGMTETASGVAAQRPELTARQPGASGRALAGATISIEVDGRPAAPDEVGEIVVSGPMVFAGYLRDASATDAVLRDGRLRTGDLGSLDATGLLTVADRREDLIVSGGENVAPSEVEAVLCDHPDVLDACVVGIADGRWGAVPVAAVVLRTGSAAAEAALRAFARERLASFRVPARLLVVPAIPRTAGGKVRRAEVRALFADAPLGAAPAHPPAARHTIRRDDADLAYSVSGSGPGVVLLHATLSRARAWRPLVRMLAGHARVVSIDRRGHRASPDPDPMRLTFPDHIADVAAVIEREALAPAVLVGHSFGGCAALDLAAARPDLVRAVIAYEPPYIPVAPTRVRDAMADVARAAADALDAGDGPRAVEVFLRTVLGDAGWDAMPPAVRATVLVEGDAAASDSRLAGLRPDRLGAIAAPVTIAVGELSRHFYVEIAEALVAAIPGARLVRVAGADHMGAVTHPDAIRALIEEALAREPPEPDEAHEPATRPAPAAPADPSPADHAAPASTADPSPAAPAADLA
jgi:O-succinylbenzoic acid--CoA ligase